MTSRIAQLCIIVGSLLHTELSAAGQLTVAIMPSTGAARSAFYALRDRYVAIHPDAKVDLYVAHREEYKKRFLSFLQAGQKGPADIYYWYAGERLFEYARAGLLAAQTDVWNDPAMAKNFSSSVKTAVTWNKRQWAVPVKMSFWGIYYRKSIFDRFNLKPPKSWAELTDIADKLRAADIIPFALGSKEGWPLAAWFDYLDFRLNGLDFHLKLLRGNASWTDPKVRRVFESWKELIKLGYFQPDHAELDWKAAMPYWLRGKCGMFLMADFAIAQIPPEIKQDIGFFPFPAESSRTFEDAPLDVFVLARDAANNPEAHRFLRFLSYSTTQATLAEAFLGLPVNNASQPALDPLQESGRSTLKNAKGIAQFFDRDSPSAFHAPALNILQAFVANPELLDGTLSSLEELRVEALSTKGENP